MTALRAAWLLILAVVVVCPKTRGTARCVSQPQPNHYLPNQRTHGLTLSFDRICSGNGSVMRGHQTDICLFSFAFLQLFPVFVWHLKNNITGFIAAEFQVDARILVHRLCSWKIKQQQVFLSFVLSLFYVFHCLFAFFQTLPQHWGVYPLWSAHTQWDKGSWRSQSQLLSGGHLLSWW